jgi:hypothetical protein
VQQNYKPQLGVVESFGSEQPFVSLGRRREGKHQKVGFASSRLLLGGNITPLKKKNPVCQIKLGARANPAFPVLEFSRKRNGK